MRDIGSMLPSLVVQVASCASYMCSSGSKVPCTIHPRARVKENRRTKKGTIRRVEAVLLQPRRC